MTVVVTQHINKLTRFQLFKQIVKRFKFHLLSVSLFLHPMCDIKQKIIIIFI